MFQEGQHVIYERTGVCRITGILPASQVPGAQKQTQYYQLTPVFGHGLIYIPVDTAVFMRPILTRQQALALIHKLPTAPRTVCTASDSRTLMQQYRSILHSNDCDQLISLIKMIYEKKHLLEERGRHASQTDLAFFRKAQSLLYEELAVALEIPLSTVPSFIEQQLAPISAE